MTVSVADDEPPAQIGGPLAAVASVVGRNVFYNNSRFDGDNPSAGASDDAAIAVNKSALLPGQTATFANYTSYRAGINGVTVDIAGLTVAPTAADFIFRVGNNDDPNTWSAVSAPASITTRPGAGVGGSARVSLVWSDGAIANTWLQVTVRATSTTGLTSPDVFYFGNAIGESGDNPANALVNAFDQLAVRSNPRGLADPVSILSALDFDRDGLVGPADEIIARSFATFSSNSLRLIAPRADFAWTDVIARMVFYNHSQFDGNDASANAADDGAIATDKRALVDGGTATFANYTSFSGGINGVMVDIAGLSRSLTAADFDFRVGNGNDPSQWIQAPPPSQIVARFGAGQAGSTRVSIVWPDGAIRKQWLQVRVKATANTGLTADDVFYFGNAVGETGDSPANAVVGAVDQMRVRGFNGADNVSASNPFDINRDRRIDAVDEQLVVGNFAVGSAALKFIKPVAPSIDSPPANVAEPVFSDFSSPKIVWRGVFYNNSGYDGGSPAAGAPDDRAIAIDKSALLPGQTASYVNYTSYSRGLNGVMIDVAGLPGDVTADDFAFRVGNSLDVGQWLAAPRPAQVTVRHGAGSGGSTRIMITWPDGAIQNQWLQVTLKASSRTGLTTSDVFYFGNLLGESGNATGAARVTAVDQALARSDSARSGRVPITAASDHNRDSLVDGADEWIAVRSSAAMATLRLFTAPTAAVAIESKRQQIELFNRGDAGYNVFFAPTLVKTASGAILAIAEGRYGEDDHTSYALVMRRSLDGGATWSAVSTIVARPIHSPDYIGNPAPVVDAVTGRVFLLYCKNTDTVFVTSTGDDGLTWSEPVDITSSVKVTAEGNPNPDAFPSTPWGWYATGPGHGIQIQSGPYAGRLIIASDHRLSADRSGPSWSHIIYSDDHGQTWKLGGGLDQEIVANDYSNECSVVEQSDGKLYMSIRINDGASIRGFSRSTDGGATWSPMERDQRLTTFGVQATLLRVDANTVLLSAPDSSDGTRHQMTLWISRDDMVTWTKTKTVFFGYAGYSDMVLVAPETVLLAYNRGHANCNSWQAIGLARFTLSWLENEDPYQFTWHFNEQPAGQQANIEGTTIQDFGPWDARARAIANSPAQAPVYVAGPGGHTALALTRGSDAVMVTPSSTNALQFSASDSFTIELVMRTTDSLGIVLGSKVAPGGTGWTLKLLSGVPKFMISDSQVSVTVSGSAAINDGLWHRIAIVRDAQTRRLTMYVDDRPAVEIADTTVKSLKSNQEIWLGSYHDGSNQLAMDIDLLRVTRTALPGGSLIRIDQPEPPRFPSPVFGAGSPDTLGGLQFWLPAYDPSRNFGDLGYADPVPLAPVFGTAVHAAIEASPNKFQVSVISEMRQVLYADDALVGPSWLHSASSAGAGEEWIVHDSNGTSAKNFDFVQNTGVFTLSTFIKSGASLGASMALFDTSQSTAANAGFSMLLTLNGSVTMQIVGPNSTIRFSQNSPAGLVSADTWYHVAAVGRGPGIPVTFYITPVTATTVASYTSSKVISGDNGSYPTDANHNLTIGSLSYKGQASFNGQMVDQAIYNRALSQAEIQQLFDYTKR